MSDSHKRRRSKRRAPAVFVSETVRAVENAMRQTARHATAALVAAREAEAYEVAGDAELAGTARERACAQAELAAQWRARLKTHTATIEQRVAVLEEWARGIHTRGNA